MTPAKKKTKPYKVLTVGPDIEGRGGISSVLKVYRNFYPGFSILPTNSRRGHLAGYISLLGTLAKMPFKRMAGFNIIHAHGASGKSFVRKRIVLSWGKMLGFRTIFHCHGGGFADYGEKTGITKMAAMLDRFDAIACLSDKWLHYFADTLRCRNISVIENVVEKPEEPAKARVPYAGEPLRLLFLGKICKEKGIFELVEALSILKSHSVDTVLTIGGTGMEDEMRQAADKAGVSSMLRFEGWVDGRRKAELMRTHHIMVLPSYIEGLPISLLEAGAYSMTCIATPVGAITELITDGINGTIVPVGDSKALAEAIEDYSLHHEKLLSQGAEAAKMVRKHFPDAVKEQLDALYSSVINSEK